MVSDPLPVRWWQRRLVPLLLAVPMISVCSEYGYTSEVRVDVFQQDRLNTVDVLMVVDNSCSMADEQEKLADNFQAFIDAFQGVEVDWQIAVVTTDMADERYQGRMLGGDDEIELRDPNGRTIDRVSWKRPSVRDLTYTETDDDGEVTHEWTGEVTAWPATVGVALQLDPSGHSSSGNDDHRKWCEATEAYGDGDLGSPGEANAVCDFEWLPPPPSPAPDTGDTGEPEPEDEEEDPSISTGDVLITEFMRDPSVVSDSLGEWVELLNTTDRDIDLAGFELTDAGRNSFTFADGATIAAGAYLVVGRSDDSAQNGGVTVDVATGADMTLANDVKVLTPETDSAEEIFGELVAVGVEGSGIEMGLAAAEAALSDELLAGDNLGFLREDANLSLIFVSDENDYSGAPVSDYLRTFKDLKGDRAYRDNGVVNISAVVGSEKPDYEGLPSCESENGYADYGVRYVDLASRTDGALESICDEDFSPIAHELGLTVSGLELEFSLSESADESTLEVSTYRDADERSLIAELTKDEDYTYVVERNAIRFEAEQVPPSEAYIVVEYKVLATGARNVSDTGGEE